MLCLSKISYHFIYHCEPTYSRPEISIPIPSHPILDGCFCSLISFPFIRNFSQSNIARMESGSFIDINSFPLGIMQGVALWLLIQGILKFPSAWLWVAFHWNISWERFLDWTFISLYLVGGKSWLGVESGWAKTEVLNNTSISIITKKEWWVQVAGARERQKCLGRGPIKPCHRIWPAGEFLHFLGIWKG